MSGLEIAGFIVGLSAIASIFEQSCDLWRTLAQAGQYGEDVAKFMNKFEMEFFRFQAWWTALENLAADPHSRAPPPAIASSSSSLQPTTLIAHLQTHIQHPIINAASNVLRLLDELETILVKNEVLIIATNPSAPNRPVTGTSAQSSPQLAGDVKRFRTRQKAFAKDLLESTSWFRRVRHDAAPWRMSDSERLTGIHNDLKYWNDSLYGILPPNVRESVLKQGIAGYLLDTQDNAFGLSKVDRLSVGQGATVVEIAALSELRKQFRFSKSDPAATTDALQKLVRDMKKSTLVTGNLPSTYDPRRPFSLVTYNNAESLTRSQVLMEWYPFPPPQSDLDTLTISRQRMARLSRLLQAQNRPSTLHSLDTLGFVENTAAQCFGLISHIPNWSSPSIEPVTLYHLLSRKIPGTPENPSPPTLPPLPTLEKRYVLASVLASTLYTFMLTKWHHKRYHSSAIYFLFSRDTDLKHAVPDLTQPFVGGYSDSRPDAPYEITIPGVPAEATEMYLHPDLRVEPPKKRPEFKKSFEIYSFGILLAEIGWWNVLPAIVGRKTFEQANSGVLRQVLKEKCRTDLGCWMGERYRDVTLRCLNAENLQDGGVGDDLNDFYWQVVLELIKCAPDA